jgi:hypothetical protein
MGFLLVFVSLSVWAAPPQDPLWRKAVEIARRNKPWTPGITDLRIELLDDKGNLKESYETRYGISSDGQGKPVMHVERAVRNGKDVTETEKAAQEKRNAAGGRNGRPAAFFMGDNPFDPDVQDAVEVTALEETRTVDGKKCSVFDFTLKKKDGGSLQGTAVLLQENGAPVEVSYTMRPLPVGVQRMAMVLHYGDGPSGDGFLRAVSVEGAGGVLFFKRNFRSMISLDGYWKNEGT